MKKKNKKFSLTPAQSTFWTPSTKKCYVYIEESFDTIFNMDYGGGATGPPPMLLRVKKNLLPIFLSDFLSCHLKVRMFPE